METFSEKILVDDLTPRQRKLILSSRWVYKWKAVDGTVMCKARLVARGDIQRDVPDALQPHLSFRDAQGPLFFRRPVRSRDY